MVLKLHGSNEPLKLQEDPPTIVAIRKFLDKAPADELFTSEQIASLVKASLSYVKDTGAHELLKPYTLRLSTRRLYGNPKAIAELRKQVGK